MNPLRLLFILGVTLLPLRAQQTIDYTNGENNATTLSTTAPNNPTTLSITTGTATQSGLVFGSGAVDISGGGILVLSDASNSYMGGTTVTGGTLSISANGDLGNSSGGVTLDGGTLETITDTVISSRNFSLGAGGATLNSGTGFGDFEGNFSGTGGLTITGSNNDIELDGNLTYASATTISNGGLVLYGTITQTSGTTISSGSYLQIEVNGSLAGNVTNDGELDFNHDANFTFAGIISGSGDLNQNGPGTLTLTGINTYSGATIVASGAELIIGAAGSITSSDVTINGAGSLVLGGNKTIGSLAGSSGSTVALGTHTLTVGAPGSTTYAGTITSTSSAGSLIIQGANTTLILTGSNVYTGSTTINSGILVIAGSQGNISNSSGVNLANSGAVFEIVNNQTISNLSGVSGSTVDLSAIDGNFNLTEGTATSTEFDGVIEVTNDFSGDTSNGLVKVGSGTLTLTGANTYSGDTTISAGTLVADNTSGSATGTGSVAISNGGTLGGTGAIAPSGTNAVTVASGGNITPGGVQTIVGGYPGHSGALAGNTVNGSLTLDTTNITANSTILAASSGSGLTFALGAGGAGAGSSASVSQLLVTGGVANIMNFNIGGSSSTIVAINDLVTDGALTVGADAASEYILIQGDNTTYEINGAALTLGASTAYGQQILSGLTLMAPTSGNYFSEEFQGAELYLDGDNIVLAVPEPGTWALLSGGLGLLAVFHLRRQNRNQS